MTTSTLRRPDGKTSHLLPMERAKASFGVDKMTEVYYGGIENVKRRRFIISPITDVGSDKYEWSREELMERSIGNFIDVHKDFTSKGFRPMPNDIGYMSEASTLSGPMMPGFLLFLPTLAGQASEEQLAVWYPKTLSFEMVGAYCQTELAHGSNIRGLETTATFDDATGDFILNSPNLSSIKWWNSGCGAVATHGAVFASLRIKDKNYGNHCFLVQLRDENHRCLPGIECGDVGVKLGDNGVETAYIVFKNVRVPREHLMAKRQHVTRDGRYVKHNTGVKDDRMSTFMIRATMIRARAGTVASCAGKLAIAATIAARYSCVRLQGFEGENESDEIQIIDYSIQGYRVLRQIANSWAFRFTSKYMNDKLVTMSALVAKGADVPDLPEIHAASSGLKSVCTRVTADGIEDLRRACGGHGYLLNSGIAALAADFVWTGTAEGDFVLILQSARYLLKCYKIASMNKNEELPGLMKVLEPLRRGNFDVSFRTSTESVRSKLNAGGGAKAGSRIAGVELAWLHEVMALRVLALVKRVGEEVEALEKKIGFEKAFNMCALKLETAATAQITHFIFTQFKEGVEKYNSDPACKTVLTRLCLLYGCSEIVRGTHFNDILGRKELDHLESSIQTLISDLRPEIAALADAFDIPDSVLNSTIGRSDGNVYEALFEAARKSGLNKHVPFVGYERVLRPHLDLEFLKLRGKPHPSLVGFVDRLGVEQAKM